MIKSGSRKTLAKGNALLTTKLSHGLLQVSNLQLGELFRFDFSGLPSWLNTHQGTLSCMYRIEALLKIAYAKVV